MNEWLLYERKRNAFEKKWKPRIQRVLNNQLQQYVSAYRRGESTAEAFGAEALTKLLFDLYADVGGYWGRSTYKDLRTETRGRRTPARVGGMAGGKALAEKGILVKRFGALGFSIDWANRIISRLRMAGLNLAQYISETTRSKVLDILEDAQKQILDEQGNVIRGNLTLDQIVDKITTEVQEINRNRAEMIARTEVGRASSEGKMQGAKALGVELEKIWISARDNRTRFNPKKDPRKGDHWVLNGQRQPLDEPFDNGVHKLMQPGDPAAPPAETIRCRCTVVFEVKKDVAGKPVERNYLTL